MARSKPGTITIGVAGLNGRNLSEITRQISTTIGTEFFESLVRNIGQFLKADCVYIGEFVGGQTERVRTLAAFTKAGLSCSVDYPLAGSAIALLALGQSSCCTRGAQKKFPSDALLAQVGAQAFVAVPLRDSKQRPLGVILAAFRHALIDTRTPTSSLEIFAPRAAAELRRQQADAELRESDQRYQVFISKNADAMWRIEFEIPISTDLPEDEQIDNIYRYGYLAECNDAMAHILGREKAEQLIGSSFEELARRADPNLREDLRTTIRSGYRFDTVETKPLDADGHPRHHVRSHWCIVENGKLQRIWGIVRDITELKRAEAALQTSERRLAELLSSIDLLTVMLDSDGSIAYCNNYLLQLTGWKAGELAGKNWFDLMVPAEERARLKAEFASACESLTEPRHIHSTLVGKNGRRWLVAWESSMLRDPDGHVTGVAGVGREISGHTAIRERLIESQKSENIRRSISELVQDLWSIMTAITGYCTILRDRLAADECPSSLMEIQRAAERGGLLVEQLLALGKDREPQLETLNPNAIIEEVARAIQAVLPSGVKLYIELDPSLNNVCTDAVQFRNGLLNLAMNAIEAMPDGGRLTLHSSNIELNEESALLLNGIVAGHYVLVAIADTGQGMTEDVQAHLFEPFFSTKENRTGLGLSTLYEAVHQSHGHILVESTVGVGTVFQIYFPRVVAGE